MSGYSKLMLFGCAAMALALGIELRNRARLTESLSEMSVLRDAAELTIQSLESRLQSPDSCTEALAGQIVTPGNATPIAIRFVLDPEAEPESEAIASGAKVTSAGLYVAYLKLHTPQLEDMRTVILDHREIPTELHRFDTRVEVMFSDEMGRTVPLTSAAASLSLPLYVWTLPPPPVSSGQIVSCFRPNSAGRLCNDLGGYFIPHAEPYDQSCRYSLKTLKRGRSGLIAAGNCRFGGIVEKPRDCKRYGVQFSASQIQSKSEIVPLLGARYLCQICQ